MSLLDSVRWGVAKTLLGKRLIDNVDLATVVPGVRTMPPPRDTKGFLQAYGSLPWLAAVTRKVSSSIAAVPWKVGYNDSNGEFQEIEDHPLKLLLDGGAFFDPQGIPQLTGVETNRVTQVHMDLVGEAFWALERNGAGVPIQALPMPPHWISDVARPGYPYFDVEVPYGWAGQIAARDIVWFRDPDPEKPFDRGSGVARALADELNTDEYAAKFVSSFLANRARPDLVVTGTKENTLSDEDLDRLEAAWKNKFRGPNKSGNPFFSRGHIEVKEIGSNFRDNQMVEIRQFERDLIVSVWGIPPEKLGILSNSNRSTIDAADLFFAKEVMVPRLELRKATLQQRLVPEYDSRLIIEYENPVDEDMEFILNAMKEAPDQAFSYNEWRSVAKHEEIEGLDEMVEPSAAPAPPSAPGEEPPEEEPEEQQRAYKGRVRKDLTPEEVEAILSSLREREVVEEVSTLFEGAFSALARDFGAATLEELGSELEFELTSSLRAWAKEHAAELVTNIEPLTRTKIRSVITDALEQGAKIDEIADAIMDEFESMSSYRAARIAQTESTRAAWMGADTAMRQAGEDKKVWLTTRDGRARDTHARLDGQVRTLEQPFEMDGFTADGPGGFGVASQDVNCRCAVTAYYPELDDESQRAAQWEKKEVERVKGEEKLLGVAQRAFDLQERAVLTTLSRFAR